MRMNRLPPLVVGVCGLVLLLAACGRGERQGPATGSGGATGGDAGHVAGNSGGSGGSTSGGSMGTGGASAGGGSAGTSGDGMAGISGGGGRGAGGNGGAGGACASAVAMGACTVDGQICSSGCTDACSFCNLLRCVGGTWQRMESFPAPCFSCGPALRCRDNAQYCQVIQGGPAGSSPTYTCRDVPSSCPATPTCACLPLTTPPSTTCTQAGPGQLTTTLNLP